MASYGAQSAGGYAAGSAASNPRGADLAFCPGAIVFHHTETRTIPTPRSRSVSIVGWGSARRWTSSWNIATCVWEASAAGGEASSATARARTEAAPARALTTNPIPGRNTAYYT